MHDFVSSHARTSEINDMENNFISGLNQMRKAAAAGSGIMQMPVCNESSKVTMDEKTVSVLLTFSFSSSQQLAGTFNNVTIMEEIL